MKLNQRRQFAQVALFSLMALGAGTAFAQAERGAPGLPSPSSQAGIKMEAQKTPTRGQERAINESGVSVKSEPKKKSSAKTAPSSTLTPEEKKPVHATGLQEEIRENDNVVFDVQDGKKGLNAVNVKLA